MMTVSSFPKSVIRLVIVRNIWQKLSSVERKEMLVVTDFWQLFPQIFGETSLIVTNIWQSLTCIAQIGNNQAKQLSEGNIHYLLDGDCTIVWLFRTSRAQQ